MASDKEKQNCKKKVRYKNDADAQNALKRINSARKLGMPRRVYKCSVCADWHLSSSPKH